MVEKREGGEHGTGEASLTTPGGIPSIERIERKRRALDEGDLLNNPGSQPVIEEREGGEHKTGETFLTTPVHHF